jgi:Zn-dependent M28 family amino/carboxypeptidase
MNGADDDGSGSMALLELAEYFARNPAKRSLLFVWHTAEEKGLFGSEWYAERPTVARDSIVAQLNLDMIGRGAATDRALGDSAAGYLQLIGSRRLSTQLGDLVDQVNTAGKHGFTFDYQFDANGHPQQYYCRSDHYNYAKFGIPIVFFSTGSHRDYHMVTDEPQYIDYPKYARVAGLIMDVGRTVANLDQRVVVDKPKPLPGAQCVQ